MAKASAHLALTALLLSAHLLACGSALRVEETRRPPKRAASARRGAHDPELRRRRLAQAALSDTCVAVDQTGGSTA